MYDAAPELYSKRFEKNHDEFKKLSNIEKNNLDNKLKPINLKLEVYNYNGCFTKEELDDKTQEGVHKETTRSQLEVKEEKRIKNLNSKQAINQTYIIISTNKSWK